MENNEEIYTFKDVVILILSVIAGSSLIWALLSDQFGWLIMTGLAIILIGFGQRHLKEHLHNSSDSSPKHRH